MMANQSAIMSPQAIMKLPSLLGSWGSLPLYCVAVATILSAAWLLGPKLQLNILDVPSYTAPKKKWIHEAETLIKESYHQFRDRVYQIEGTEGVQVLTPSKHLAELKELPDEVLSITEASDDTFQSRYTGFTVGRKGKLLPMLVQKRLTPIMGRLFPQLKGEVEHIVNTEFPACDDWTSVKWQPFALRTIAQLTGRASVGGSINRQDEWMDVTINYAAHVFKAVGRLQVFPTWARPVAQYFISELRPIRHDLEVAKAILQPILEERIQNMELATSYEPPDDMMQWLLEALPAEEKTDLEVHAKMQLILAAASTHATTNLLFECMSDLAADPDILAEVREEAYQILEVEGGWPNKVSMAKLQKMDSFMREVQRLSGNITSFARKAVKPITLSDGTHIPAGTTVMAPLAGISTDARFIHDPEKFDPLRFYHMRQESAQASARWQFTSLSDTYINFGAGRHACPGRFFAGTTVKLILAYFVINYDVRLKKGQKRPVPIAMVNNKAPDPNVEFEFKRRSRVE